MSSHTTTEPWPTPAGVAALLDDVLHTDPSHPRPALRYLRRKPGRGLVAVYGSAGEEMYTVMVDEAAVTGEVSAALVPTDSAEALEGGTVHIDRLGVTIERFPDDERLPGLAAAIHPAEDSALWTALATLAAQQGEDSPSLRSVTAVPLRYKPGDRCVIRYRLRAQTASGRNVSSSVIGKLYRSPDQAQDATTLAERLWELQGAQPWAPRPLGVVEPLALALTEDLGSPSDTPATVMGTEVLRMGSESSSDALRAAATALADLHLRMVAGPDTARRTGAQEALKSANRAATISRYVPELAGDVMPLAVAVGEALEASTPGMLRPAHGSYKPSQLLCREGSVLLVDFDQFCLADPALDLGYFLAYLRPPGLWYHRSGTRSWFEHAAATFVTAYAEAAQARGMSGEELDGVTRRCHVYAAALLLKIAARRPNRLHSARPGEVRALLTEIAGCLAASTAPTRT
jgi:aminoglycoside phosphotransferase (APT) family kinase protein